MIHCFILRQNEIKQLGKEGGQQEERETIVEKLRVRGADGRDLGTDPSVPARGGGEEPTGVAPMD